MCPKRVGDARCAGRRTRICATHNSTRRQVDLVLIDLARSRALPLTGRISDNFNCKDPVLVQYIGTLFGIGDRDIAGRHGGSRTSALRASPVTTLDPRAGLRGRAIRPRRLSFTAGRQHSLRNFLRGMRPTRDVDRWHCRLFLGPGLAIKHGNGPIAKSSRRRLVMVSAVRAA
jgi:hypothetical protein